MAKKLGKRLRPWRRLSSAAPEVIAARLAEVRRHERAAAAAHPSREAIHHMRVATRRLRVALTLFEAPGFFSRELKTLQDALGAVRDAQLHAQWLSPELPARTARLSLALDTFRSQTAPRLDRLALSPRGRLCGPRMRRALRRPLRKLERRLSRRSLAVSLSPRRAHRLRVAIKKLRYRAELLERALGLQPLLAELSPLADALGELHDLDVSLALESSKLSPDRAVSTREELAANRAAAASRLSTILSRWRTEHLARAFRRSLR